MTVPSSEDKITIENLVQQLEEHNYRYHTLDAPNISDTEYDALFLQLQTLEARFPTLIMPHSPTQRIGGQILSSLEKRQHTQKMYGLDNVFDTQQWHDWVQRMRRALPEAPLSFWCDPKLDGLALELVYEHGQLVAALTRGDGEIGEVVTQAVRTVRNIPLRINATEANTVPRTMEIRGEIVMYTRDFAALNTRQCALGLKPFANARNATAGAIRQLDSKVTATRPLRFFAYGVGHIHWGDISPWQEYAVLMQKLTTWGFAVPPKGLLCPSVQAVMDYVQMIEKERHNFPMEIDGAVIKQNFLEAQAALGFTARSPRFAVAFKLRAVQAQTRLLDIDIQVGRTGVLTPVAVLEPVSVGGVTVSRATLHNEDELQAKDVRIGDTVIVQRAGDVIPEVVGPVLALRAPESTTYIFPHRCPVCGEAAQREPNQAAWRCVNISCPAVRKQTIQHFVSKAGLDVQGIGQKWIKQLVDSERVTSPADLFTLRVEELLSFERMGEVLAQKFVDAFESVRHNATLTRFFSALSIRHVGTQTARILAEHFTDADALAAASTEELMHLPDVGPEVAMSIRAFFTTESNIKMLHALKALGVWPQRKQNTSTPSSNVKKGFFTEKNILFTGSLHMPRSKAQNLATDAGAVIMGSVSKKLDYLIVGESPGSKLAKAQNLGIAIITETEFLDLITKQDEQAETQESTSSQPLAVTTTVQGNLLKI